MNDNIFKEMIISHIDNDTLLNDIQESKSFEEIIEDDYQLFLQENSLVDCPYSYMIYSNQYES
jgi:hypothetical protein